MTGRRPVGPIVIDARWLGYTGIGRLTGFDGLREIAPAGDWVLWGPTAAADYLWPGARHEHSSGSPLAWFGQRDLRSVPRGRYVALHLVRPLVPRRNIVVLAHDTIPVRWGGRRMNRLAKRAFYAASVHTARRILVYSESTTARVRHDLRLPNRRIARFDLGIDPRLAPAIRERREQVAPLEDRLLYVGLHEPHKNLARAIEGFRRSRFAAAGATFVLVGAANDTLEDLRRLAVSTAGPGRVEVFGRCSEDDLVAHYAAATATIQPSLDEGLGLTVVESLAAGIRTCCNAGGALDEASCGAAVGFDGLDVDAIAAAIDTTVLGLGRDLWAERFANFDRLRPRPTPRQMADRFLELLDLPPVALTQPV
jgi:glycosyltransferase involved in cell wall biosynthesis